MKGRLLRGELLVLAAALMWALIGVGTRELGDLGLPGVQVGAWRALIGGACFVAHLSVSRRVSARPRPNDADRTDVLANHGNAVAATASSNGPTPATLIGQYRAVLGSLVVFCAVGVVVFYASLPLAIETGGISLAWVLLYTAPVWVSIGAALSLGERVGVVGGVAVAVSVGGVMALVSSVGGTVDVTAASVTWGLASGVSYSSYYLVGRRLFESIGAVPTYAITLPVGGVVLALIVGLDVPSAAMVPWLLLMGFGCTYLPCLAFGYGIQDVASSRAVVIATVEPVLAILIGVAIYGETLGVLGVLGGAAVLAAAITVGLRRA